MIKLGGKITLDNFESIEPGTLVVVKKMIGNYAKKISEKNDFDDLKLTLLEKNGSYKLEATLKNGDKEDKKYASHKNLFFAVDEVLAGF